MKKKLLFIISGIILLGVVISVIFLLPKGEESYRSIKVFDATGTQEVIRNDKALEVYEEMILRNNDEIYVHDNSNMILKLDSDKFIYLEEATRIKLISSEKDSSKTVIRLLEGKIITEVKEKLGDDSFEVETPNSVMAIRGTTFSVEVNKTDKEYEVEYQLIEGKIDLLIVDKVNNEVVVNSLALNPEEAVKIYVDLLSFISYEELNEIKEEVLTNEQEVNEYESIDDYINSSDKVKIEKSEYNEDDFDVVLDLTEANYRIITIFASFDVIEFKIENEHLYEHTSSFTVVITADVIENMEVDYWLINDEIYMVDNEKVSSNSFELLVDNKMVVVPIYKDIDEACNHDYQTTITDPTCQVEGLKETKCSKCGDILEHEVLPVDKTNGHAFSSWAPSLEHEDKHVRVCNCGETETSDCTYDEGVVTKEATHFEKGVRTYTCTVCGRTKEESIDKTVEHVFSSWAPSLEHEDKHVRVCNCGEAETSDCTYDEGRVTKEATHFEEGVRTYTCTVCGRTKEESIDRIVDHVFSNWTPSQEHEDKHVRVCNCGETETGDCTYDEGRVTKEATHFEEGVRTYTCTVCGRTKEESIDRIVDHVFSNWTPSQEHEDKHVRVCNCGETETGDCTYDEGHVTKEPSHIEEGVRTYTCTVCGRTKEESIDKTNEHEYGNWIPDQINLEKHYKECQCGELIIENCTFDDGVTDDNTGAVVYTCTVCGRTKEKDAGFIIVISGGTAVFEGTETVTSNSKLYGENANVYIAQENYVLNVSLTPQEGRTFKHWVSATGTVIPDEDFSMLVFRSGYYYPVFEDMDTNNFTNRTLINEGNCEEGNLYISTNALGDVKYELEFLSNGQHYFDEIVNYNSQYHMQVCTYCGEVIYDLHEERNSEIIKEAGHTEEGQIKYECYCGHEWLENIPVTDEHTIDYDDWDIIEPSQNGQYGKYRVYCKFCDYYEEYWYLDNLDLVGFMDNKMIHYQYTYGGKVCNDEYYYSYRNEEGKKVYIWAIQYEYSYSSNADYHDTYIFMYIDDEDSTTIEPIYLSKSKGDGRDEYLWAVYGYAYDVNDWIKILDSPDYNIGCKDGMLLSNSMSARSSVLESYHNEWAETYNNFRIPTTKEYNDLSGTYWEIYHEGKAFEGGYYDENDEYVSTGGRDIISYVKDKGTSYQKYIHVDKETGITYGYEDYGTYYRTIFIMRKYKDIVSPEEYEAMNEADKSVVYSYGNIEQDIKSLCSKRNTFNNFTLNVPENINAFRLLLSDPSGCVKLSGSDVNVYNNSAYVYDSGNNLTLTWNDEEGLVFDCYEIWDFENQKWVLLSNSSTYTFNTSDNPCRDAAYVRVVYHKVEVPVEPGAIYTITIENGHFEIDGKNYRGSVEVEANTLVYVYYDYISGKTFDYWVDQNGEEFDAYSFNVTSNMTLTPVYIDTVYNVYCVGWNYDSYVSVNGGEMHYSNEFEGKAGESFELNTTYNPEYGCDVFLGWYMETNGVNGQEYILLSESQIFTYKITGEETGSLYAVWTTGENPFVKKYVDIRMTGGFVSYAGGEVGRILDNAYSVISLSRDGRVYFYDDPTDDIVYNAWDIAYRYELEGEITHDIAESYQYEDEFHPAEYWLDNPEYSYPDGVINVTGTIVVHHDYIYVEEIPATCLETGIMEHYYCSVCEKTFDMYYEEIEDLTLPIGDHDYIYVEEIPNTCLETGIMEHYYCSVCEKIFDMNYEETEDLTLPIGDHTYEMHPQKQPTFFEEGNIGYYLCGVCGKYFDEEYQEIESISIPKLSTDLSINVNGTYYELNLVETKENEITWSKENISVVEGDPISICQTSDSSIVYDYLGSGNLDENGFILTTAVSNVTLTATLNGLMLFIDGNKYEGVVIKINDTEYPMNYVSYPDGTMTYIYGYVPLEVNDTFVIIDNVNNIVYDYSDLSEDYLWNTWDYHAGGNNEFVIDYSCRYAIEFDQDGNKQIYINKVFAPNDGNSFDVVFADETESISLVEVNIPLNEEISKELLWHITHEKVTNNEDIVSYINEHGLYVYTDTIYLEAGMKFNLRNNSSNSIIDATRLCEAYTSSSNFTKDGDYIKILTSGNYMISYMPCYDGFMLEEAYVEETADLYMYLNGEFIPLIKNEDNTISYEGLVADTSTNITFVSNTYTEYYPITIDPNSNSSIAHIIESDGMDILFFDKAGTYDLVYNVETGVLTITGLNNEEQDTTSYKYFLSIVDTANGNQTLYFDDVVENNEISLKNVSMAANVYIAVGAIALDGSGDSQNYGALTDTDSTLAQSYGSIVLIKQSGNFDVYFNTSTKTIRLVLVE